MGINNFKIPLKKNNKKVSLMVKQDSKIEALN